MVFKIINIEFQKSRHVRGNRMTILNGAYLLSNYCSSPTKVLYKRFQCNSALLQTKSVQYLDCNTVYLEYPEDGDGTIL